MVAPLVGYECTRVSIDSHAPPVVLSFLFGAPPFRIEISGAISLQQQDTTSDIAPGAEPTEFAPLLRLVGQLVTRAEGHYEGPLVLEFSNGDVLRIAEAAGEPWNFEDA